MKGVSDDSIRVYPALLHMQYFALLVLLVEAWNLLLEFRVYTHLAQEQRRLAQGVTETEQLWFLMVCGHLKIVDMPFVFHYNFDFPFLCDRLPHRDVMYHR